MWNMLKVNSRDCVSLLTNCNISKTFFQVFFWCTVNMSLSCSFLISLLPIFKRFHMPWYTFSVISFKSVLGHMLGRVKVNKITKSSSHWKPRKVLENTYFEENLRTAVSEKVAPIFYLWDFEVFLTIEI